MIKITVLKSSEKYVGFSSKGHAGSADYGDDIVCAGVSALVLNTINSVDAFTEDAFEVNTKEETGEIDFRFHTKPSEKSTLLMDSMILGLTGIIESYNSEYMKLTFKEV